ncbi:MAG: trypsin-like peptidase domain-containing protein, partial [Planctomycetota bacterium]
MYERTTRERIEKNLRGSHVARAAGLKRLFASTASLSVLGTAIGVGLALGGGLVSSFFGSAASVPTQEKAALVSLDEYAAATAREVSSAFEQASRQIAPSVVRIESFQRGGGGYFPAGQGSGVILDEDGLIATNAHVVRGSSSLKVILVDGRDFDAKIVGLDNDTDLALLRISAAGLQAARLRTERPARVGEWVIAVGNPLGLGHSVTAGIVSGEGRNQGLTNYDNFLQTDAAINPGNSGGPLVDLDGEVIGINTAVVDTRRGGQGIGFAIPAQMVSDVVGQLAEKGRVSRGYIGVQLSEVERDGFVAGGYEGTSRVMVSGVVDGGPADRAGLEARDIIDRVDGQPVTSLQKLMAMIARLAPGTRVPIEVVRDG